MGEIADNMINGLLCRECGGFIDGNEPGYERFCDPCANAPRDPKEMDDLVYEVPALRKKIHELEQEVAKLDDENTTLGQTVMRERAQREELEERNEELEREVERLRSEKEFLEGAEVHADGLAVDLKRSVKVLRIAYEALQRDGWEEGPTAQEASEAINDHLANLGVPGTPGTGEETTDAS